MKFIEYTQKIVGLPYCAGGRDPQSGLGCFTIVYEWLRINMPGLPEEYHGYTLANRREKYDANQDEANTMMLRFFDEYLIKVDPAFAFVGDVLWSSIVVGGKEYFAASLHAGNAYMLGATPQRGVVLLPLRAYKVHRAWRIPGANRTKG